MRKLVSLVMALVMIVSAMAVSAIGASAEMGDYDIDYVEALYFTAAPTIDGYITEEEWGAVTIEMQNDWCATKDDSAPYYNSFFYWKGGTPESNPMEADIWLRWDENYYYVGVKVRDYDGHSLKHGKNETWNGDALQFRVDPEGPNAATYGEYYSTDIGTPWSAADSIPDFITGYVQIAGGFVECYDNANYKGLTAYSNPVFGAVKVAVAPSEQNADNPLGYHDDAAAGYTTYELAIPWKYIFQNNLVPNYSTLTAAEKEAYTLKYADYDWKKEPYGGIGRNLGMSLTVFNAAKGEAAWNSFMSWGSGTTQVQVDEAHQTCAGSNCVTLSADKVTPGSYTKYDPSKLEAVQLNNTYDNVFYDYLGDDIDRSNPLNSADSLETLTYDEAADLDYWGSAEFSSGSIMDVGGEHGSVLSYDRVVKTHTDDDGKVHTAGVDPIDSFYIDTRINAEGTRAFNYPLSYTFEADVMYTGNEIVQEGRASELGNWFGGADAVSYYCGYSFNDKKFIITDVRDPNTWIASYDYDLVKGEWYNWKFQYDNDSCTVRLLINDEVVFNVYNRYFYYSNEDHLNEGTMMIWWFINTQMKMDNVKIYNFYDYVHKDSTSVENNNQGGSTGGAINKPTTSTGGDKIDVEVIEKEDGTITIPVLSKKEYKTVTSLSYTLKFDTAKFDIQGINGLDEADYKLEQAEDGSYVLTIVNLDKIKAAATATQLFEIVLKIKDGATAADLDTKEFLEDSFTYTVATGDGMLYVAVIAAVMLAGCAVVVSKKRKSF